MNINGYELRDISLDSEQAKETLYDLLETVDRHDRVYLRNKVTMLKESDGEGWAVGELLERTLNIIDALRVSHLPQS